MRRPTCEGSDRTSTNRHVSKMACGGREGLAEKERNRGHRPPAGLTALPCGLRPRKPRPEKGDE